MTIIVFTCSNNLLCIISLGPIMIYLLLITLLICYLLLIGYYLYVKIKYTFRIIHVSFIHDANHYELQHKLDTLVTSMKGLYKSLLLSGLDEMRMLISGVIMIVMIMMMFRSFLELLVVAFIIYLCGV